MAGAASLNAVALHAPSPITLAPVPPLRRSCSHVPWGPNPTAALPIAACRGATFLRGRRRRAGTPRMSGGRSRLPGGGGGGARGGPGDERGGGAQGEAEGGAGARPARIQRDA
uniref:Uncharacterized protein n=1 Tax=Arundo donax TaxID=35708 RepID=A0A0A9ADL3_ARUDO